MRQRAKGVGCATVCQGVGCEQHGCVGVPPVVEEKAKQEKGYRRKEKEEGGFSADLMHVVCMREGKYDKVLTLQL